MLGQAQLIAFAQITEPARAAAFYRDLLGLTMLADEPFALVFDANGVMLRLAKVSAVPPSAGTVLGWQIDAIRPAVQTLTERGIIFERFEGMAQDSLGICTFPDGAMVAWFRDPDGNLLSLTQSGAG